MNEAIKEEAKLLKAMVAVAEAKADTNTKDVACLFFWWKTTVVAVAAAAAAAVGLKLWAQK